MTWMKYVPPALIALLLSGCAQAPATDEEKSAAIDGYLKCLVLTAPEYDDGRSDASTIGVVMNNACRREYQAWLDVSARGQNAGTRQIFFERMEKRGPEMATQVVLKRRAALARQQ